MLCSVFFIFNYIFNTAVEDFAKNKLTPSVFCFAKSTSPEGETTQKQGEFHPAFYLNNLVFFTA